MPCGSYNLQEKTQPHAIISFYNSSLQFLLHLTKHKRKYNCVTFNDIILCSSVLVLNLLFYEIVLLVLIFIVARTWQLTIFVLKASENSICRGNLFGDLEVFSLLPVPRPQSVAPYPAFQHLKMAAKIFCPRML